MYMHDDDDDSQETTALKNVYWYLLTHNWACLSCFWGCQRWWYRWWEWKNWQKFDAILFIENLFIQKLIQF